MAKHKGKKGYLKLLIAVLVVAVVATGGWFFFGQSAEELPPSFEIGGSKFQGRSITDYGNFMKFDATDVGKFEAKGIPNENLKLSEDGVQYFYAAKTASIKELLGNIKPEVGMRMLAAVYIDSCYHVYPQGPFDEDKSCLLTEAELSTTVLKQDQGFALITDRAFEYNVEYIRGAKMLANNFEVGLPAGKTDWIMHPASSDIDLTGDEILFAYKQIDNNKFKKVTDLVNFDPSLEEYKMLWVKAYSPFETPSMAVIAPQTLQIAIPTTTYSGDAKVGSVKYLINNIDESDLSGVANLPEQYTKDFLLNFSGNDNYKLLRDKDKMNRSHAMAFADNLSTPYIASAIEVEITGTKGAVILKDVEYFSAGSKRNKLHGIPWVNSPGWKTQSSTWCVKGAQTQNLRLLTNHNGVLANDVVMTDFDSSMVFKTTTEAPNKGKLLLTPGKHILVIELTGLDSCAHTGKPAPDATWTKNRVDFRNIFFTQGDGTDVVYYGEKTTSTPAGKEIIESKDLDRQFYLKDNSPGNNG